MTPPASQQNIYQCTFFCLLALREMCILLYKCYGQKHHCLGVGMSRVFKLCILYILKDILMVLKIYEITPIIINCLTFIFISFLFRQFYQKSNYSYVL